MVVVGSSLGDRDEALDGLATTAVDRRPGGAAARLAGRLLDDRGGAAARRRDAPARAEISSDPGERLPVPEADDELRRLGETLNAMLGRLEQALERERRFVDDASHELRTPLALHKIELELALLHALERGGAAHGDRLGDRRDRPADRAGRAAAGRRPRRRRRSSRSSRSGSRSTTPWPRSRRGSPPARARRPPAEPSEPRRRDAARGRSPAGRAGAHEPGRERVSPRARAPSGSRPGRTAGWSSCT